MKNVLRSARAVVVLSALLVASAACGTLASSSAGADPSTSAFYLAIGGSASLGVQPTVSYPKGQRTDDGYADYLVADEATKGIALNLTQIGCSGETTDSMLYGGDKCYALPDTQLNEALTFLKAHQDEDGLVTIDLGFNDLLPCIHGTSSNTKCVEKQLDTVRDQLSVILALMQDVAGPNVKFIGLGHYDPFLGNEVISPKRTAFAKSSLRVIRRLDQVLSAVYKSYGIPLAQVGDAFKIYSTNRVSIAGIGTVPENVAQVCLLTWMCQPGPLGPNIHPNAAGYQTIATAIEQQFIPW